MYPSFNTPFYTIQYNKNTKKYYQSLSEIEDIRNILKQIGNDEMWFEWIDKLGSQMESNRDISDPMKKELLKIILDNILVDYDQVEKVHKLTINFKIPVYIREVKEGQQPLTLVIVNPPKSGRKPKTNNTPLRNYSTVAGSFPTTPQNEPEKGYSLRLSVHFDSSNLWVSSYTPYQQNLFDLITMYHEQHGWNFQQISDYLIVNNFLTPRGKTFTESHVWSIYTKKKKSINRFSREYDHVITDMKVDVIDYIP